MFLKTIKGQWVNSDYVTDMDVVVSHNRAVARMHTVDHEVYVIYEKTVDNNPDECRKEVQDFLDAYVSEIRGDVYG